MSSPGQRFIIKVFLIMLVLGIGLFLLETSYFYYKIKKGKIKNNFTLAKKISSSQTKIKTEEILNDRAPSFGAAQPELVIVEFASFLCPHSRQASQAARELMIKYKDKVKFIFRDYPLDELFPGTSALSLAGRCAAEQNNFWAMHDKLYQSPATDPALLALQSGLDKDQFSLCLQKQKYLKEIEKDLLDGFKNGVRGTPTFFFVKKGHEETPIKIEGAIPRETFEKIINRLLK